MWIRILRVIQFRLKESIVFVFVHNYKSFEHTTGIKYRAVGRETYSYVFLFRPKFEARTLGTRDDSSMRLFDMILDEV